MHVLCTLDKTTLVEIFTGLFTFPCSVIWALRTHLAQALKQLLSAV